MWNLLLVFSILPVAISMAIQWWFGFRVIEGHRAAQCRVTATRWEDSLGSTLPAEALEASADDFGQKIRLAALDAWQVRDGKRAAARKSARTFGVAVPPLTAMVAVFAVILAKIPVMGAIAIFVAAIALSCVFGLLSLPAELHAVAITARRIRERRVFTRADDEDAAISCAIARAWTEALPPILKLVQPAAKQVIKRKYKLP